MPEIKYEASMTEYYGFILAAARTIYNQDKEVRSFINDSTPTCLRGCLRKNHGDSYHGTSNKETQFDCSPKGIRIQTDENYIVLSWSQMTKFMQDNASKISGEKSSDFPCDNCGYDNKGCCDYPDSQEDYCVMGDKQIPVPSTKIISTPEYNRAVAVNSRISAHALAMQDNLFEVCKGLKEMRDDKLYKELGYKNFEEYCEAEHGITRQQGHKFLSIANSEIMENVKSTLHFGTEKLYLLSRLTDEEREEIAENNDVESMTVKELESEIKKLKSELSITKDNLLNAEINFKEREELRRKLGDENMSLQLRIKELESRPIDVAVQTDESAIAQKDEKIAELKEEIEFLKDDSRKRFIIMLTFEEYDELMKITETSPKINSAIKSAKILKI